MIPREQVPQTMREAQHPLPNGNVWQHTINEVRRAFGHTATADAGWQTERVCRPVLILGQLDGILTGIRQLTSGCAASRP